MLRKKNVEDFFGGCFEVNSGYVYWYMYKGLYLGGGPCMGGGGVLTISLSRYECEFPLTTSIYFFSVSSENLVLYQGSNP